MFENKKVIIFDLDGTLIDSMGVWDMSVQKLIKYYTGQLVSERVIRQERDYVLSSAADSNIYMAYFKYLKEKYGISHSLDEIMIKKHEITNCYIKEKVQLKEGAVDLLYNLKKQGYKLALATTTNKYCVNIYNNENPYTSIIDFDYIFDLILTIESVKHKKPHPEIHEKIMAYFNVRPCDCLIFEDSIQGIEAGHNAHIEVVGVVDDSNVTDFSQIQRQADYVIYSLSDLLMDQNSVKVLNI